MKNEKFLIRRFIFESKNLKDISGIEERYINLSEDKKVETLEKKRLDKDYKESIEDIIFKKQLESVDYNSLLEMQENLDKEICDKMGELEIVENCIYERENR